MLQNQYFLLALCVKIIAVVVTVHCIFGAANSCVKTAAIAACKCGATFIMMSLAMENRPTFFKSNFSKFSL